MIPLAWNGNKRTHAAKIASFFPRMNGNNAYAEPFVGTGAVLQAATTRMTVGTSICLNDANKELVNAWAAVAWHGERLDARLESVIPGVFNPEPADFIDVAANYFLRNWQSADKMLMKAKKMEAFTHVGKMLRRFNTAIYNEDWETFIKRLRPYRDQGWRLKGAVIYCDPPYIDTQGYKGLKFGEAEHRRLSEVLHVAAGDGQHVYLSINDSPLAQELYGEGAERPWKCVEIAGKVGHVECTKQRRELLFMSDNHRSDCTGGLFW